MKISRKNVWITGVFFFVTVCFLFHAQKTANFAYVGLKTWFDTMIISLFPFMVLMNLLIRSGFSELFIKPFHRLLRPIFRNTEHAMFVLFFGFLCGFPLGAKAAVDLYKKERLSKDNAEYLLCFSNNIGPSYLLGFFVTEINPDVPFAEILFCFYGLPLLYGILLRYTVYKKTLDTEYRYENIYALSQCSNKQFQNVLSAIPEAVTDALRQIATLGGYMIFFNALRVVPHTLFYHIPPLYLASQSILEISGGLLCIKTVVDAPVMKTICLFAVYSFNGLCCHFQTFSILQATTLSKKKYMLHKIVLCSITVFLIWLLSFK